MKTTQQLSKAGRKRRPTPSVTKGYFKYYLKTCNKCGRLHKTTSKKTGALCHECGKRTGSFEIVEDY